MLSSVPESLRMSTLWYVVQRGSVGVLQYLDLGKTYVHWKQGHPQAAAQGTPEDASDVSSEEGVNPGSDSGKPSLPSVSASFIS